jgi:hypothetical protein
MAAISGVLVDQVAQTTHQARALLHRQVGPFRERLFGGGDGLMNFGFTAGGDFASTSPEAGLVVWKYSLPATFLPLIQWLIFFILQSPR